MSIDSLGNVTASSWTPLRTDFPIFASRPVARRPDADPIVYLDNASTTQPPRQVLQRILEVYEKHYANVHRGTYGLAERTTELYEQAREKVRAFINAPTSREIIVTSGTTQAINLVARTWGDANLRANDEILASEMEHHSNLVPWHQAAQRTGAVVRHIPITQDGRLDLDALDGLLSDRTRLVAVTAVSNVLGTVNPIEEIVRRAHAVEAMVLVDGAQAVPHQPIDVTAADVDFLAFSGHKMLAPNGVGILYGRQEILEAMPPFAGGGSMICKVNREGFTAAELPAKFEAGTPPIISMIGLGAAIDYLNALGMEQIAEHERRLTEHAHEVLRSVPGLKIIGPEPRYKGGIVSFTIQDADPLEVAKNLDRFGIAVRAGYHCAMPLHERLGLTGTIRASFYLYNTLDEIDYLADSLARVCDELRA